MYSFSNSEGMLKDLGRDGQVGEGTAIVHIKLLVIVIITPQ